MARYPLTACVLSITQTLDEHIILYYLYSVLLQEHSEHVQ